MSHLGDERNKELNDLVNFLMFYKKNKRNNLTPLEYHVNYNSYKNLCHRLPDFNSQTTHYTLDHSEKIGEHYQMVCVFDELNNDDKKNVIRLAWFLVDCRKHESKNETSSELEDIYKKLLLDIRRLNLTNN